MMLPSLLRRLRPTMKPSALMPGLRSKSLTLHSDCSAHVGRSCYLHWLYSDDVSSAAKLVQQRRLEAGNGTPGLNRASSTATNSSTGSRLPPPARSPSSTYEKKSPLPPPSSIPSTAPPPYSPTPSAASFTAAKKAPPPPPPLKPKPKLAEPETQYVVALYDFEAQADGDLDFKAGDRIEVVERTQSTEDWWTGRFNGRQGVFPGARSIFMPYAEALTDRP